MCKHIVGTENHVNTIRLINTIFDNFSSNDESVIITSGSVGEGLQMRGSDLDTVIVLLNIEVNDNMKPVVFHPSKPNVALMTEETKPGYAMLCLMNNPNALILDKCKKVRGENFLSSALLKKTFLNELNPVVHGPCISDIDNNFDFARCFHSKSLLQFSSRWVKRSNNTWPNENTKQIVIDHGVLLVPIGAKGSPNEELEWRISFSVGEKFLIYTFNHTQLICYALMKILLKDVINTDSRCTDILCSYYLKTLMFWLSEESQPSVWTPDNLIPCFMRCFSRLIYCVQYQVFPHYFIPENNLFENKIEHVEGLDRKHCIRKLRQLFSGGWRYILENLFPKQISHVSVLSCNVQNEPRISYYEDINTLLKTNIFLRIASVSGKNNNTRRAVHSIMAYNSTKLKYLYVYFLSKVCHNECQSFPLSSAISNKNQYKQYNTCLSYLLMNINHDIVSGWLMLASFFYKEKQYEKSLLISMYALSKCTPAIFCGGTELSDSQLLLVKTHVKQKPGVVRLLKFVMADNVVFATTSFSPVELLIEANGYGIRPVVYAHFLSFLCNYHLKNVPKCTSSIRRLERTIAIDNVFGNDLGVLSKSYYFLGTALHLKGHNKSARTAFCEALKLNLNPRFARLFKRLAMVVSLRKPGLKQLQVQT
ncbi:uncharacterized protein LOC134697912 [Mytilus trossulus]|uniref:uncharacterized protein LOC134697912 n=1 Tax=Mytilus trossulus TaxID=6551 RepID=UPI0030074DC5